MTRELLKIAGGTVHDPANGIDGQVLDLWIEDGKIIAPPTDPTVRPTQTIDARGLIVMPGGVDMHCHIAGSKVNAGRKLRPEDKRQAPPVLRTARTHSGTLGSVPSTLATGYQYAALGYTTAFDAAVAPLGARHAHLELADTPCLDKGIFVLMGNNHYVLESIRRRQPERLRQFVAWLLKATGGYAPKLVNPGGVENWKGRSGNVADLDARVDHFDVTPREIIAGVAQAAAELNLPHPVHIHTCNLGLPGNWTSTLETMRALEGRRGHLAHIQFHSYGGGNEDEGSFCSQVAPLVDYFNTNDNVTVDVGQVLFGETTSMTGDGPLGHYLSRLHGAKWFCSDVEQEAGCGVSPIVYKHKSLVNAWQWAIGLEWFLLAQDPWRIALSTDHPNGASFLAYPQIIELLMSRDARRDALQAVHPRVRERSLLSQLDREYSLQEICILTRAAPARILGLTQKGHLGPGADADLTLYSPEIDRQRMFELPRHVIKGGQVLVSDGEIRQELYGEVLRVTPPHDPAAETEIAEWFEQNYSVQFGNYALADGRLPSSESSEGEQPL